MLYSTQYISLELICRRELYFLAYKIINNLIKHNFLINRNIDIHSYNTRNKLNFYLSLFKTNKQKSNVVYTSLNVFNSLSNELKSMLSFSLFKVKIRDLLLNL